MNKLQDQISNKLINHFLLFDVENVNYLFLFLLLIFNYSDLSGDSHTFSVSTSLPSRIPLQGYRFGYGRYLKASSGFLLPNSFTINLWFRMDTTDSAPNTRIQYLYLKSLSGVNKFFIGVNNNFLRIYINGAIYDYYTSLGTNSNWRYLSVSVYTISLSAISVQIFLDSTKLSVQTLRTVFYR